MTRIAPRLVAALCAAAVLAPAGTSVAHAAPNLRPAVEVTHLSTLPGDGDAIPAYGHWIIDYPYSIKWRSTSFTDLTTGETLEAFHELDPFNTWHFMPAKMTIPGHTYRLDVTYTTPELEGVFTQSVTNTVAAAPEPAPSRVDAPRHG